MSPCPRRRRRRRHTLPVDPRWVIEQKRDGRELDAALLADFLRAYLNDEVADYQMTAFLMAVYLRGMTAGETEALARAMLESGRRFHWNDLGGPIGDKHSTGGVGDKISLILAPVLAVLGLKIPMVSGRGLGHTGGTLDKLESIPGYRTRLTDAEMTRRMQEPGLFIAGQSEELVPADRRLYALRDVTATVSSAPLIVSSILSKKAAAGVRYLVLDVKFGEGAFMTRLSDARRLARLLVETAHRLEIRAVAVLTRMEGILGRAAGNAVEVTETLHFLSGEEDPPDIAELVEVLGGALLVLTQEGLQLDAARRSIRESIASGDALRRCHDWLRSQGASFAGQNDLLENLPSSPETTPVRAERDGYVARIHGREAGWLLGRLGGGRLRVEDRVKPGVGILVVKPRGSAVRRGEILLQIRHEPDRAPRPDELDRLVAVSARRPRRRPLIAEFVVPESAPPDLLDRLQLPS
ncbi:MAG: thymidine phosphorylase [Candidatus Eisenbacteria bacterium]|nr:thymidine phosphorylase [Candidatus Eisenbacteria bacterium]